MKKILLALVICMLLTGCSIVRIDTDNIENIYEVVLSKNNTLYNQVGKGYKYYVPKSMTYIDTSEFNDVLYSNGNYYYLYLDVISYYYKEEMIYTENEKMYYSKKINVNEKDGYLEIEKQDNKYLINYYYNYALLTSLVDEKDINEVILNASYILSTVKYNDSIIKLTLDENFNNKEQKYDKFTNKKDTDNFYIIPDEVIEE